jgi:hypothetical protein
VVCPLLPVVLVLPEAVASGVVVLHSEAAVRAAGFLSLLEAVQPAVVLVLPEVAASVVVVQHPEVAVRVAGFLSLLEAV